MCISYDALACQVWLDPIAVAPAGGQPLCADHAQRLSAPRGWVVLDRRTSQSTLMTAAGPAPVQDARGRAAIPRRRLPRAWGQFDAPRLEFLAEDDAAAEPDPTFDLPAVATALLEPEVIAPEPEPVVEPDPAPEIHAEGDVERHVLHASPDADPDEPELRAETAELVAPEPEVVVPEPEPEPEPEPVVVSEPEPEPEPAPKPVAKKAPARRGRATSESGPLGAPKGRLLSRAFEASGPQRSAITESLEALGDDGPAPEAAEG